MRREGASRSSSLPVVISEDIQEGERAWRRDRRQVFHYDDFLDHVTYGELRLRKNEGARLARFIQRFQKSKEKRFILTTREYILSEARHRYERLSDIDFDPVEFRSAVEIVEGTFLKLNEARPGRGSRERILTVSDSP